MGKMPRLGSNSWPGFEIDRGMQKDSPYVYSTGGFPLRVLHRPESETPSSSAICEDAAPKAKVKFSATFVGGAVVPTGLGFNNSVTTCM